MNTSPLLIEIGVEEIPAGVAEGMYTALCNEIQSLLSAHDISLDGVSVNQAFTPRRLLAYYNACPIKQPDCDQEIWGPPERIAFDEDGKPTGAATGFAKKSGVSLKDFDLADKGDGKGRYMHAFVHKVGRNTTDILAEAMPKILGKLPSPKRMKWNDGANRDNAFIRPIRWIVARLGDDVIPFSFAGVESGKISHGHRIVGKIGEMDVKNPVSWLKSQHVMLQKPGRIFHIQSVMSKDQGYVSDDELLQEVADLTEWPVPIRCSFAAEYLRLPSEVIRITLKNHQRCFRVSRDSSDFFAIANIESKNPDEVAKGNARVVNARLADAAFYYDRDPKVSLEKRVEKLSGVIFQDGLGMVGDQVRRLRGFVLDNAKDMGVDSNIAQRAAYLCKSDLTTGLVGEFPELQGYMGAVYAHEFDGEDKNVALAIASHYQGMPKDSEWPLGATGESLRAGRAIAIAENIDKLLGYFHIGRMPTASADPYALRRAAINLVQMLSHSDNHALNIKDPWTPVNMTLWSIVRAGTKQWNEQRITVSISEETQRSVYDFIIERLLNYHFGMSYSKQAIDAALHANIDRPLYQTMEIARLLSTFSDSETGQAVAAANKRIANILKKAGDVSGNVDAALFSEPAEKSLFAALAQAEAGFPEKPKEQLKVLADLREPVDRFFDDVMVMAEDANIRANRLALLARLRALFLRLADVS
ncbi:MAG: glycine--tRNA ligase subunit beta, partial [Mariprofundaceae bacterium]|nr:glycine--tRNA ligase subunit beta [Mariprofundaceae bacterium]